jgi:exodeoxyribonuclease-3
MRIVSWNINGLRASFNKGAKDTLKAMDADIICLIETKVNAETVPSYLEQFNGYSINFVSSNFKGYSGTAILSKTEPISVIKGIADDRFDDQGRTITAEFNDFFQVCVYVPFVSKGLYTKEYCQQWHKSFRKFLETLKLKKDVVVCGDFNISHQPIDIFRKEVYLHNEIGSSKDEVTAFDALLSLGFTDTFRFLYPNTEIYSWWPYSRNSRENNHGMRLDYFLITDGLLPRLHDSKILTELLGSDHCPIVLDLM